LICETTKYELIYKLIYCEFYIYVFMNKCPYIYMYIDFLNFENHYVNVQYVQLCHWVGN
jgi:hypothetical protein